MFTEHRAVVLWGDVMYTNADMTLYHYDGTEYVREVIKGIFWQSSKISNVNKTGRADSDSVFISIPAASREGLLITTGTDLVVCGVCELEIDNTNERTQSESLRGLKNAHDVFTVTAFDAKLYGTPGMQHYELSCK